MTVCTAAMFVALLIADDGTCIQPASNANKADGDFRALISVLQNSRGFPPDAAPEARDRVALLPPGELAAILHAMHDQPLPVVNWLRSAGDEIIERALKEGSSIPFNQLDAIARDAQLSPHPRRIALQWCEQARPGYTASYLRGQLNDPVFAADAVAAVEQAATEALDSDDETKAVSLLTSAFQVSIEPEQAFALAAKLTSLGQSPTVHQHLGFITTWRAIGPFPGRDQAGVATAYPPEERLDFNATYPGKSDNVRWRIVSLAPTERFLDLKKAIEDTDDAVGYLATVIKSDRERSVQLRAGADDNLQVWVNGSKVIDASDYHQRPRLDKHRATVTLKPGHNEILAKVCEVKLPPGPASGSPARWQFSLRIVDADGRGIAFPIVE